MFKSMRVSLLPLGYIIAALFFLRMGTLSAAPTDTIRASSFSGNSGVTTDACSEGGRNVTSIQAGDFIYFSGMDFGSGGIQCFEARVASDGNGGFIELRLDSETGKLIGTCEILPPTGGWQTWTSKACHVSGATGTHTLYLVFKGGVGSYPISNLFNLNWFTFHGTMAFTAAGWRQSTNAAKGVLRMAITLSAASAATPSIEINPEDTTLFAQRVDGWGGAFNENGYECIKSLSPGLRAAVMRELYDPVSGCRFNYGRVPIGMNDFTVNKVYSLNEKDGDYAMNSFSLANDSLMNIAFVKSAMAANPNIMIHASPWTPPSWMKTNDSWEGSPKPTIIQNAQTWTAYALYISKFIKGWKQAGIAVNIVYPQNEPGWCAKGHPSCSWTGTTLKNWVRDYLYPKIYADSLGTQIWMGTFHMSNYGSDIQPTLEDAQARNKITGIGVQRSGNAALGSATANAFYKSLHYHSMQTETHCWAGANSWSDAMNTFQQIHNHVSAGANMYTMWNMILHYQSNFNPWMVRAQNSLITITPASQTVRYNPEFYVMKHWSYYARAGAVRLKGSYSGNNLLSMAFKNPDGSIVLMVQNSGTTAASPVIRVGSKEFKPALEPSSVNTFNIGGTETGGNWVPATAVRSVPEKATAPVVQGPLRIYTIRGRLVKVIEHQAPDRQRGRVTWDQRDFAGKRAAAGMYVITGGVDKKVVQKVVCPAQLR